MYKKSLLPNAALLVTERVAHFKSLSIGLWVKAGSRQDGMDKMGLAHLVEHLMFKGNSTQNFLELAKKLDATGAEFDAATSREHTYFVLNLPVKELEFALYFLESLFSKPDFTEEDLAQEKKIITHEITSVEENPEEYIDDILMENAYKKQAIGNPILGTKKSLLSLTSTDVREFFNRYYTAKNILITAVGNIEHAHLEERFGDFSFAKDSSEERKLSGVSEAKFYPGIYHAKRNLEQSHILVAYEAYHSKHPNKWALSLLNNFLGDGESSKLFQLIREESGLAYNVYSYVVSSQNTGLFIIYLATDSHSVEDCLSLIKEQIDAVKENSITEEDLDLMKSSFNNAMLMDEDSSEDKMMDMGREEIASGEYWNHKNVSSKINKVSLEDITRVAQDIFSRSPAILELSASESISQKIKKQFGFEE